MALKQRISDIYNNSHPVVMGIINVTPDSFFSESRCNSPSVLLKKVDFFINQGASIIDVGACSTRPNAPIASEEEEGSRLFDALKIIREHFPNIVISVDTFRSTIARRAVEEFNVNIINDVFAFEKDSNMLKTISLLKVPYVLTHSIETKSQKGKFMNEIIRFFTDKIALLQKNGIEDIIVDPGYGFGKTPEENFELLTHQSELLKFGFPILSGLSRKRMVWQTLNIKPEDALNGTTVLNTIALMNGASILRVHDVKEAYEAIQLSSICRNKR